MDELTDLLVRARDGDRWAWSSFVRATQAEVWRLAARLAAPDAADDVTQDVYLRAWRAARRFRGDASARTWLLAIARRACADAVRSRVRRRRLEMLGPQRGTAVAPGTDASEVHGLWELVDQLPARRREAFVLTQVVGCSYQEAADICRIPVGTIRSRVARAREQLIASIHAAETG